jgi:hypothetical protein
MLALTFMSLGGSLPFIGRDVFSRIRLLALGRSHHRRFSAGDPNLSRMAGGSVQHACARNKLIGNKSPQYSETLLWENNYPDDETF